MNLTDSIKDMVFSGLARGTKKTSIVTPLLWLIGITYFSSLTTMPFVPLYVQLFLMLIMTLPILLFAYVYLHWTHNNPRMLQTEMYLLIEQVVQRSKFDVSGNSLTMTTGHPQVQVDESTIQATDEDSSSDEPLSLDKEDQ